MKQRKLFIAITCVTLCGGYILANSSEYFGAAFITQSDAAKKWGAKEFNPLEFKNASEADKAAMAVDAIKKKSFVGQKMTAVREKMGDPDSYFFSDTIYAYKITNQKNSTDEAWHLVFIPDKDLDKVAEVKIHKKCCYPVPPWAK